MSATKPQTVCRLCSKIGKGYRSLFSDTNKIADKISKCLPILVNQNDELPSHICPLCLRSLNISYKLLIQAIKVDSQLRQRLLDTQMELKEQRARENVARSPQSMDAANLGICGICEIRFDDAGAFDSHMEMFHQSKWVCNLCQSDFPTSEELLQHKHKTHYDIDNIEKPQESECVDSGTIDIKEERISDSEHSDSEYTGDTNIPKRASKRQGSAVLRKRPATRETSEPIQKQEPPKKIDEQIPLDSGALTTETNASETEHLEKPLRRRSKRKATDDSQENDVPEKKPKPEGTTKKENAPKPPKIPKPPKKKEPKELKDKFIVVKCEHCDLLIDSEVTLIEHRKLHEPYEIACADCGDEFHTAYSLCAHRRDAHSINRGKIIKFFCKRCNRMMGNLRSLRIHERSNKPRPVCKYCQADFCNRGLLRLHLNKEHRKAMMDDDTATKWTCDYCKKVFVDKKIFYDHVYLHSRALVYRYNCAYCEKDFGSASSMKNHVEAAHDRVLKYECQTCKKKFYNKKNLQTHEKIHMKLQCKRCKKKFDSVEEVNVHMTEIHDAPVKIKPIFVCPHCDRKFNRRATMENHKNTHSGKTPQTCPICQKQFRTYAARWAHIQRHNNFNGFFCDYCQKKFVNKGHLKTHIAGHRPPEEWAYTCEICGARFPQISRLTNHRRKHTGERKYLCDFCGSKYVQKGHLDKHIRTIHATEITVMSLAASLKENAEECLHENTEEALEEKSEEFLDETLEDEFFKRNTEDSLEENGEDTLEEDKQEALEEHELKALEENEDFLEENSDDHT